MTFTSTCQADDIDLSPEVFTAVSNLYNPTIEDLQLIQYHLANDERPILKNMGDKELMTREFKIIGNESEMPEQGNFSVNSNDDERENCIILYSSFNERYPNGIRRLVKILKKSDFKGHVHYRIGGWPNVDEGDLTLVGVPFAFKPCFFKEVQKMGYKKVLWLDASILPSPTVSLNKIFTMIEKTGYFVQGNMHMIGGFMNEKAANVFGLTLRKTFKIPSCSAAILGIDFTNPQAASVIEAWYTAAKDPHAFYSERSDQNALSIIFFQKKMLKYTPITTLGTINSHNSNSLFLIDREFVKEMK